MHIHRYDEKRNGWSPMIEPPEPDEKNDRKKAPKGPKSGPKQTR